MKKIICLMLIMCVVLLSGCSVFGSKNDYLLEEVPLVFIKDIDGISYDAYDFDMPIELGFYKFYTFNIEEEQFEYYGKFEVVNVKYDGLYKCDILVDKTTFDRMYGQVGSAFGVTK